MIIKKEFKFDAAHMLSYYEGPCANLHGHTYTGTVTVQSDIYPATSMVLDYNVIKEEVGKFDHRIIFSDVICRDGREDELLEWALKHSSAFIVLRDGKCTAENISRELAENILHRVPCEHATVTVELHETLGSTAIQEVTK